MGWKATHVSSTLILRAGDTPSLNSEWWKCSRHDFMWPYVPNSTNAMPRLLLGLSRCVSRRTAVGLTDAKCARMVSAVALYGRLPVE